MTQILRVALAALLAVPAVAFAQTTYPKVDLLVTGKTSVGETIQYPTGSPAKITTSIVTVQPGQRTLTHTHPAPLVGYMLDGDLTVDYGEHGRKIYHKGEALVEAMNVAHYGINEGTIPVRLLIIFVGTEDLPIQVPVAQ